MAGPGILRRRGWVGGSCGRGPAGLVVGCRNCGGVKTGALPKVLKVGRQSCEMVIWVGWEIRDTLEVPTCR